MASWRRDGTRRVGTTETEADEWNSLFRRQTRKLEVLSSSTRSSNPCGFDISVRDLEAFCFLCVVVDCQSTVRGVEQHRTPPPTHPSIVLLPGGNTFHQFKMKQVTFFSALVQLHVPLPPVLDVSRTFVSNASFLTGSFFGTPPSAGRVIPSTSASGANQMTRWFLITSAASDAPRIILLASTT